MARVVFYTRANKPGSEYRMPLPYTNRITHLPRIGETIQLVQPSGVEYEVETIVHVLEDDEVHIMCKRTEEES